MPDVDSHAPSPSSPVSRRGRLDAFFYRHHPTVHAGKTALATIIGLVISSLLNEEAAHPEWIVITIVVVMTMLPNVGGVLQRSLYRLVATCVAALIALGVMYFTDSNPLVIAVTLVCGVIVFTIVAQHRKFRQVGVMCAVTLAVLLEVGEPNETVIVWRGVDILIGAAIALLVTRFVCPIRASRQLRFHVADTIDDLGRLFTLAAADQETAEVDYEEMEDKVARGFMAQRELLPLAMLEHPRVRASKPCLENMIRSQRAIFGLSRTLRRAYSHTVIGEQTIASLTGLANVRSRLTTQVHDIANGIREGRVTPEDPELQSAHSALKVAMKQSTREMEAQTMSPQAFTFTLEQIISVTDLLRKDAARVSRDLANAHDPDEPAPMVATG